MYIDTDSRSPFFCPDVYLCWFGRHVLILVLERKWLGLHVSMKFGRYDRGIHHSSWALVVLCRKVAPETLRCATAAIKAPNWVHTCQTLRLPELSSEDAEFLSVMFSMACAQKVCFKILI